MTAPRGRRGYRADRVIVDEVQLMPLVTVDVDIDGVEHVVMEWPGIEWPRQYGRRTLMRELSGEVTVEGPAARALFAAFEPLFAADLTRHERMLHRLAADLQIPVFLTRKRFRAVQRVLEDAGIADGYGRLTIPQPARTPVPAPATG